MAGSGLKKHAVISLAVVVLMLFAPLLMLVPGAASAPGVTDTISVGNTPYGIGLNTATSMIYVPNNGDGNVSVIDGSTNTVTGTIPAGDHPWGVGVNPVTNMAYVSNWDGATVSVIDCEAGTELTEISVNAAPAYVSVNPVTNLVYVANHGTDTVTVIDGADNMVVTAVAVGDMPHGVCVNPVTNLIYAANYGSDTVSVIDGTDNTVTDTITVGDGPHGIAVNPVTNTVYVADNLLDEVSVIDGATGTVTDTVTVEDQPCYVGVNPAANLVYASNYGSDTVSVIDGADNTVTATLDVGSVPHGNAVNPETGTVYVTNSSDNTVSVIADPDIVPFSDEFSTDTLDADWTWTDPLYDCGYDLTANPGYLQVSVPGNNHDLSPSNYNAPRVTQTAGGDFAVETMVQFDPQAYFQSAGILAWTDSDNFLRLERMCFTTGQVAYLGGEVGGSWTHTYVPFTGTATYLRLVREGDVFYAYYGSNGIDWTLLTDVTMAVTDPIELGLHVLEQSSDIEIRADFDYFRFNQYSVSASVSGGHGSADPETQVVTRGTSAVVDLTPDTGYFVASVTDNGTEVSPTPTDSYVIPCVTNNHEVVVTFSPFSDEFAATTLDPGWTWLDLHGDCSYNLTENPGYLRIYVPTGGHDISPWDYGAPRVIQPAGGDFTIETRLLFDPAGNSQAAGLLVFKDNDNYMRLERVSGPSVLMYGEVGDAVNYRTVSVGGGGTTYLRLVRQGDSLTGYCSADGAGWSQVYSVDIPATDPLMVGLSVHQLTDNDNIHADFDYFRFTPTITSIAPASGTNESAVSVTDLAGTSFCDGATVSLKKLGETDIEATNVVVVDSTRITCDFDLDGAATGIWDVVVTNPDAHEATLVGGLRVNLGWGSLEVWGYDTNGQVSNAPAGNDFVAISAGDKHSVALRSDGSLVAWGSNYDPSDSIYYGQSVAPAGSDFIAVSAGDYHNLALRSDGSLAAWGCTNEGRCDVPTGNDFVAISAGGGHGMALRSDGTIEVWGMDNSGQVSETPAGDDFVAVSAGCLHSLALKSDGSLVAWGWDSYSLCDVPTGNDFVAISAGQHHNLALRSDGSLVAWGSNYDPSDSIYYGQSVVPAGNDYVAIEAGSYHNLALRADGSLAASGCNDQNRSTVPAGYDYVDIAGGGGHSMVIVQHPAPTVTSIAPNSGTNEGTVSGASIAGTGFLPGATVSLKKLGQSDIAGTNEVANDTQITCDFDLDGAATGTWDVVVTNPDTQEAVLRFGFRVQLAWGSLNAWGDNSYYQCENVPTGNDFIAVSGGAWHSLALRSDGTLAAWGDDNYGEATPLAGNDFVAVAAGDEFSLALRSNGTVAGWGYNGDGECNAPAGTYVAIAAGDWHGVGLRSDGSLAAWGWNYYGQLDNIPAGNDFVAIAAGDYHSLALRSDGTMAAWGYDSDGEATPLAGNDFVAVAGGNEFSLALRSDGTMVGWGWDSQGQCTPPTGNDFTAVEGGYAHGLALHSDGSLAAWGYNGYDQCNVPSGDQFAAVSAGGYHSLAIAQRPAPTVTSIAPNSATNDGVLSVTDLAGTGFYNAGYNGAPTVSLKKLGESDIVATNVVVVSDTQITCDLDLTGAAAGTWDVVVTNHDGQSATLAFGFRVQLGWGSLEAWGYDDFGQVGNTPAGNDFVAVAGGEHHSLALHSDGSLASWGRDNYNQVGHTPTGNDFVAVAAGGNHSLALRSDGSLEAWGNDSKGQVGETPADSGYVAVSAGYEYGMALRSDGSIVAWGCDDYGLTTPPTGNDFVAIDAGDYHGLALRADGSMVAWGNNSWGQYSVPTGNDFVAISAGAYHSLALRSDGSLASWGFDNLGQVTDTPTGSDFVAVSAGFYHSLALHLDGTIAAWGNNGSGQVGNVPAGNDFLAVSGGGFHSLAIAQHPAPTAGSIDPSYGINTGTVAVTDLAGTGFLPGATVSLKKASQADIAATNVVVVSDTLITCDFALNGAAAGAWDVVVTNPDTQQGTLVGGFMVIAPPFSDEFSSDPLDPGWTWTDPLGGCTNSLTANPGYLRISVPDGGHDISPENCNAPRVTQSVLGDFVIETRVLFDPQYDSQNAGILAWKDADNFVRLDRRFTITAGNSVLLSGEIGGVWAEISVSCTGVDTYLRLVRNDNDFTGYYSTDGVDWTLVGSRTMAVTGPVDPGLYVVDQYQDNAISADFDYFHYNRHFVNAAVSGGHGTATPATQAVLRGGSASVTLTPEAHYHVASVTDNGSLITPTPTSSYTINPVTNNHNVVATYAIDTFDITASAGANGTISPSGVTSVDYGASQAYTITPAAGYHVADVKVEGASVGAVTTYDFTNVTENHTIAASFAINTYTITASAGEGGSITPSGVVNVNHGASQSFTITPDEGWSVADVTVDGASRGAVTTVNFSSVTANHTIVASFKEDISPLATWYLAEGSTNWGFDCYISIVNPNSEEVEVELTYMTGSGAVEGPTVTMPAMSQATVFPSATLGAADFSTQVTCTDGQPISVDRTMYWTGSTSTVAEAHCATGVTAPATTWYMPEGSSNWGFECFVLIQNPGDTPTEATVTWMIEGASPQATNVTVGAASRLTLNMADYIGAADASIKVESDSPVICERAMYRNDRREGHDSGGTPTAANDYYLAEGCTGFGFTTYILVQNPNPTETDVEVTYQAATGEVAGPAFTMPANSRKTICVNDTTEIPGPDPSFSTHVHGDQPIIAERAMYWNGGDDNAQVCHDSIGLAAPHTAWFLADGQTSEGRETWTLVQNPNGFDVPVQVTYMTPDGLGNVVRDEMIPANSRKSFNMIEHSGITGRAGIMVTVGFGHKVMVERAMYWNNRGTGTDTIGGYAN